MTFPVAGPVPGASSTSYRLARALACPDPDPAGLKALAEEITDWPEAFRIVREQGLFRSLVDNAGLLIRDPQTAASLLQIQHHITRHSLLLAAATHRLDAGLKAAGVRVLHIKGVAFSRQVHGTAQSRDPGDIDILISPDDVARTDRVVTALGWRREGPLNLDDPTCRRFILRSTNAALYRHPDPLVPELDIHWRWQRVNGLLPADFPTLFAQAEPVEVEGASILAPPILDHCLFVAIHGLRGGYFRLKWMADTLAALHRLRAPADWQRMVERADALGAHKGLSQAVAAAARFHPDGLTLEQSAFAAPAPLRPDLHSRRPSPIADILLDARLCPTPAVALRDVLWTRTLYPSDIDLAQAPPALRHLLPMMVIRAGLVGRRFWRRLRARKG